MVARTAHDHMTVHLLRCFQPVACGSYCACGVMQVPGKMISTPRTELQYVTVWHLPTPDYVKAFSATAYLTAVQLYEKLNVPIGIVQASYGAQKPPLPLLGYSQARCLQTHLHTPQKTCLLACAFAT